MLARLFAVLFIATAMSACDVASTVKDGMEKSGATASAIEARIKVKPQIGFNYHNGNLTTVTVQFSSVPNATLIEIERVAREEIGKAFQATPPNLVISFIFKSSA
jgi:hypothetical protein